MRLDDRTYQWVFEDFEPTDANDIVLAFTKPYFWHGARLDDFPRAYGAFATAEGASERLGPNSESEAPPGYEAVDGFPETAWGFTAPGAGSIQVGIAGNQNLKEIRILPGRNDAPGSFYEYGRPKTVSIGLSRDTNTTISLADEPALQRFAISGTSDVVRITVLDIYPGTKSEDTYISEIDFGTKPAPVFEEPVSLVTGQGQPTTTSTGPTRTTVAIGTTTGAPATTMNPPSTEAAGTTTTVVAQGAEEAGRTGRTLWPAYLGIVIACLAAVVAVVLVLRLRLRSQGS